MSDTGSNSSDGREFDSASDDSFLETGPSLSVPATNTNKALHRQLQQQRIAMDTQKKENAILERKVADLKGREQSLAGMAMEGRERWSEQQRQIANLKLTLHQQLQSPITDEEFAVLETKNEEDRDLVDTIKLNVYKQIAVLKKSRDSAVRTGGDLSAQVSSLESKLCSAEDRLRTTKEQHSIEKDTLRAQLDEAELKGNQLSVLQAKYNDAEHRLRTTSNDREQYFTTKMELNAKSNECMRLEIQLKEIEDKFISSTTESQCLTEKLDILKSQFYESQLAHEQRRLDLENQLRVATDQVTTLKDLELEAEVFMSNIAGGEVGTGGNLLLPYDVPVSRRLQHSVSVTKRALTLENQLVAVKHDLRMNQDQVAKLTSSLAMAKQALSTNGQPYALVEEAMETKDREIDMLKSKLLAVESENSVLHDRCSHLGADVSVLHRQRQELASMKEALRSLGAPPLQITDSKPSPTTQGSAHRGSNPTSPPSKVVRQQPPAAQSHPSGLNDDSSPSHVPLSMGDFNAVAGIVINC